MATVRKCVKCGLDLTDTSVMICPVCGTRIIAGLGARIWVLALIQFVVATIFMLSFGFPRPFIAVFGVFILMGTALSVRARQRPVAVRPAATVPLSHPALYRVLSAFVGLVAITIFSILLFGFVMFMNSWTRYQTYAGKHFHQSEFVVTRTYLQKRAKGGSDVYASGTVEGQREWMSLLPYLHFVPRDEGELEERVSPGTTIPIYFFPELKGRMRVQVYTETPPAEAYHREMMAVLKKAPSLLLLTGGMLFLLMRLRRMCVGEKAAEASLVIPGY